MLKIQIFSGADGAIQAMMLSLGELQFKNEHLEFHIHPRELHRDYFFRRINYGNNTHVNISVTVNVDNKAELYVAMDKNDRQYYACDAGCLDAPVKLRYFVFCTGKTGKISPSWKTLFHGNFAKIQGIRKFCHFKGNFVGLDRWSASGTFMH